MPPESSTHEPTEILEPDFEPMPGMIIEYMDGAERVRSVIRYARLRPSHWWMVGFGGTSISWTSVLTVWSQEGRRMWRRK